MTAVSRPVAFVLANTNHGTLITNRNDYRMVDAEHGFGVGFQLLRTSGFDEEEVGFVKALLRLRRRYFGDGVVAVDCGANIGVHTVEWARMMHGWGEVVAFEPQEKVFYALAGNIALNNCFNARAHRAAVGAAPGEIRVPSPDYHRPSSFGSLELRPGVENEFIGQAIDYGAGTPTSVVTLDGLGLGRADLVKIDVEGMEMEVLAGAAALLRLHRPVLVIETIKTDGAALDRLLEAGGYRLFPMGINRLALHGTDPVAGHLHLSDGMLDLRS